MSLAIGVGDEASFQPLPGEPCLDLDNDGYYWFLAPLFEQLARETGQSVDLYGDAAFDGKNLQVLRRMLTGARTLVESQPGTWEVHVGTQLKPVHKEVYARVERE